MGQVQRDTLTVAPWESPAMPTDDQPFRIALIICFAATVPILVYYRVRSQLTGEKLDRRQEGLAILLTLRPIGLAGVLGLVAFMIDPGQMAWSKMPLPGTARWIGVGVGVFACATLVWTFHTLGKNLTDTVVTRKMHFLVTHGPYRFVRHPFYVCVLLGAIGNGLATANWFILSTGLVVFILQAIRAKREEANLLARFGDEYRAYVARTGRFVPSLLSR